LLFVPQRFEGRDFRKSDISSQGRREPGGAIGVAIDCLNSAPPQDRAFDRFEADVVPFAIRCSYRLSFDQAAKGSAE
jgi:hypothetical protein